MNPIHDIDPPARAGASAMNRRRFLGLAGGVAAAGVGYQFGVRGGVTSLPTATLASSTTASQLLGRSAPIGDRILVSLQLEGGVDFLNTLVPLGSGRYRDLRGPGALEESALHRVDDAFGLNSMPNLARRFQTGTVAMVHGVGWENSSLSHFEATDVWERGDVDAATRTGFLGRTLAQLGGADDPLTGISIDGLSPAMHADGFHPASLPADGALPWAYEEEWVRSLVEATRSMTQPQRGDTDLMATYRASHQTVFDLSDTITTSDDEIDDEDGGGWLDAQLRMVADLVNGGVGTRVFHVRQDGYDTHGDQTAELSRLLTELDTSIERFFTRLGANAPRVTLMTWTEFGRRPEWNGEGPGNGTEHGTAGVQFVIGDDVRGGHHGEPPSLTRFDLDGNFVPTTDFLGYLGGVVGGVFDIDPRVVAPRVRRTLEVLR